MVVVVKYLFDYHFSLTKNRLTATLIVAYGFVRSLVRICMICLNPWFRGGVREVIRTNSYEFGNS